MKHYKLNWRYWFFLIILSSVIILGAKGTHMLFTNQVTYYDEEMSFLFSFAVGLIFSIVLLTYLISVISMISCFVKNKGCGLNITDIGIENTLVFVNLFAFVIVARVKTIPWEAIKYYDITDGKPYIRVKTKEVEAGFFAKLILKVLGYSFCLSFVKPAVNPEDIELYKHRFSLYSEDSKF